MGQRRVRGDRRRARDRAAGFLDPRRPAADHPPAPHGAARDELPLQYKTAARAVPEAGDVLPPQHKTAIRAAQAPGTTCRHGTRLPPSPQACRDQAKRRASTEGSPAHWTRASRSGNPARPSSPPACEPSVHAQVKTVATGSGPGNWTGSASAGGAAPPSTRENPPTPPRPLRSRSSPEQTRTIAHL